MSILNRKTLLITGASTGLGRAIAEKFASQGNKVFAGARDQADLDELDKIDNVTAVKLDVTIQSQVDKVFSIIEKQSKSLDVLINNAGIAIGGPLVELNEKDLKKQFEVNVFGMWRMVKGAFRYLLKSKNSPRIINISSTAGRHAMPFVGPYSMSKYAVEAFSDSLRRELDPLGIKVVIVQPGKIKTDIWDKAEQELDAFENSMFRERALPLVKHSIKKAKEQGQDPKKIADVVYDSTISENPKIRYHLPLGKLRSFVLDKFPDGWVDWIVRKK